MSAFLSFKPNKGLRQPRIAYSVDDPEMADLEEFRRVFGSSPHGKMTGFYVQALLIGARIMLKRSDLRAFDKVPSTERPARQSTVVPNPKQSAATTPAAPDVVQPALSPRDAMESQPEMTLEEPKKNTTLPEQEP